MGFRRASRRPGPPVAASRFVGAAAVQPQVSALNRVFQQPDIGPVPVAGICAAGRAGVRCPAPRSGFAREAKLRLDIVRGQLAAQGLHVARFHVRLWKNSVQCANLGLTAVWLKKGRRKNRGIAAAAILGGNVPRLPGTVFRQPDMRSGRFPSAIGRLRSAVEEGPMAEEVVEALYRPVEVNPAPGLRDWAGRRRRLPAATFRPARGTPTP